MALKRKQPIDSSELENVFRSAPIEDRSSKFIGYFSPTMEPKELQKLVEMRSATHKILAWRCQDSQRSITGEARYVTGFDEDGERNSGSTVLHALTRSHITGACVVARWYGGKFLGPDRFKHISKCAEEAIESWRGHQQKEEAKEEAKRQKVDDAGERERLLGMLEEKDSLISDLRPLVVMKEQELKAGKPENSDSAPASPVASQTPVRPLDYSKMPLKSLRSLERSRDASLQFLLKRLDKVDAELAADKAAPTDGPP
jgi:putative IMPACT (imprinted ancient) family translation regulator